FQDVTERMDIADARAAPDGEAVFVEGVVLADQGIYDFQSRDTYIQDSTGGVRLWSWGATKDWRWATAFG
ncbi:MAG: hypothetical protein ACOC5J_03225, partial [Gemmatimonadota bacterium]